MPKAISRTVLTIKDGMMDEAREFGESKKDVILEIPKIIGLGWLILSDTQMAVVGVYENQEDAAAAGPKASEIFSEMAEFLAAPPERNIYEGEWFSS